jgi:hypothetical protein
MAAAPAPRERPQTITPGETPGRFRLFAGGQPLASFMREAGWRRLIVVHRGFHAAEEQGSCGPVFTACGGL